MEDERGVRLADLRRSDAHPAYLRVPSGPLYLARRDPRTRARVEARISAEDNGAVLASDLTYTTRDSQERGALADAFHAGLFRVGYGPSYYAGYTAAEAQLAVEDPEWEVRRWTSSDGDTVEVIRLGERGDPEGPPPPPDCECDDDDDDDDDKKKEEKIPKILWGQLTVGTQFTPYGAAGEIQQGDSRVTKDQFAGFSKSGAGQALRGFDVRWTIFDTEDKPRSFPGGVAYFRTGFTRGTATLVRSPGSPGFDSGDATGIDYFSVPLYFGGEFYAFEDFFIRPSFGLGFGLDLMNIEYQREAMSTTAEFGAGVGFELHAGVDIRINNYIGFMAELRQQWSSRIKVPNLPDVSNTGLGITTGVRVAFPMKKYEGKRNWRRRRVKERAKAAATVTPGPTPAANPTPVDPPAAAPEPSPTPETAPAPEAAPAPAAPPAPETPASADVLPAPNPTPASTPD